MYKVGLIKTNDLFEDYAKRFSRRGILLLAPETGISIDGILDWIKISEIKYLIVSSNLQSSYCYSEAEIVETINKEYPKLPCILSDYSILDSSTKFDSFAENIKLVIDYEEDLC